MEELKPVIWDNEEVNRPGYPRRLLGGKALGLHGIKASGLPVPPWATLTGDFFASLLSRGLEDKNLPVEEEPLIQAQKLSDFITGIDFNPPETQLLGRVYERLSQEGAVALAVRSSALEEDGKALSFAGQLETVLNVKSQEQFFQAIKTCWASLYGERAVGYRLNHQSSPLPESMAVVVQRMLDPQVSGVIFTADPMNGDTKVILINSVFGLGEGLVSGELEADAFRLAKSGELLESRPAGKTERLVLGEGGEILREELPENLKNIPSLTPEQLQELAELALLLEAKRGEPLDIEFAIEQGRIYFLQARPITALSQPRPDNFQVWDNSNIVESYSGVTTPLTFSFIRRAYYAVYWQFWETLGVSRPTIFKNRAIIKNMLGLIEGRVYYNLLNWYKLISLMPGFKYNKSFMEQMMGLSVIKDYDLGELPAEVEQSKPAYFSQMVTVGIRMLLAHMRLPKAIKQFHAHFEQVYSQYADLDFDTLSPERMLKIYRKLENELLWQWKAPILNDFEAMIFYGLLKKLTTKWGIDPQGALQNDLLCGEGDIRSTDLIHQLFYLAQKIGQDPGRKEFCLASSPEELLAKINTDPAWGEIKNDFERYLDDYGNRFIEEMKLESIPLKENPLFCLSVLKNYLRGETPDPEKQKRYTGEVREKAQAALRRILKGHPLRSWIYQGVLQQTRRAVKNRENQRFARAQIYNLIRSMMNALGRNWSKKGILNRPRDIFYLEIEEIWAYVEGTSTCPNLKELAELRRAEFKKYRNSNPRDHLETWGEVYWQNRFDEPFDAGADPSELSGLGCRPGVVEGEVKVVLKPDKDLILKGEILVARQTDPGWTMLFPSISGLIVEKGSMLSHSAIVAREMGIPCIVGVKNASRLLKSGDRVRMDGAGGRIVILSRGGKQ